MSAADLLSRYYDAFNRRDYDGMLALLSDDVVHDINQGGREVGKPAFAAFLARMDRHYRERVVELVVMTHGDRGAAEFVIEGEYLVADEGLPPATGQTYRLAVGAFFALRGGLITRVTNYYNLADWIRQVSMESGAPQRIGATVGEG
jgi:steroid delta-isomerase-like uncharacterized protein